MKKDNIKFGLLLFCLAIYFIIANLPNPLAGLSADELKALKDQGEVLLTPQGQQVLALMVATILAWVFEVMPIGMASVFSLFMIPMIGLASTGWAMSSFAIPTIFFVLCSLFFLFCQRVY